MASRRFFGYDLYDYYYSAPPVSYAYPYYSHHHHQPAAARRVGEFFPADGYETVTLHPRQAPTVNPKPRRRVSIPVHFVGSEPEALTKKRAEEAAVRVQAAARGFLARKAVRALRVVEREAEEVAGKVTREAEALRADARAQIAVGEALMRLLLRLDAVRGAREYRRRVTKRVLALQDAVDTLDVTQAAAEEGDMASEVHGAAKDNAKMEEKAPAEAAAEMEVVETEQALPDDASQGDVSSDNVNVADGESEMVTEEPAPAEPPLQGPVGEIKKAEKVDGGLDAKKVMEMVSELCERSAQQCAVIGALAERVDKLDRAVRRVEVTERRRAKKLKKEGRGSNHNKCYLD
jgi:hypothetical protein